jgi:hypothetical protein
MKHWRFMDYHDPSGTNLIRRWYEGQDKRIQAVFRYAINEISATRDLSDTPSFVRLQRRHVGLFEIRFEIIEAGNKKRHFRPVGFWNLNANELILVDGCEKSGRVTIPPGVFDSALDIQWRYYHEGKGSIYEHF